MDGWCSDGEFYLALFTACGLWDGGLFVLWCQGWFCGGAAGAVMRSGQALLRLGARREVRVARGWAAGTPRGDDFIRAAVHDSGGRESRKGLRWVICARWRSWVLMERQCDAGGPVFVRGGRSEKRRGRKEGRRERMTEDERWVDVPRAVELV